MNFHCFHAPMTKFACSCLWLSQMIVFVAPLNFQGYYRSVIIIIIITAVWGWRTTAKDTRSWRLLIENTVRERWEEERKDKDDSNQLIMANLTPDDRDNKRTTFHWVTDLATYSCEASRKMKKHSSLGVYALWAWRIVSTLHIHHRSITWMSISWAIGGGLRGLSMWYPCGQARQFTYRYLQRKSS